MLIIFPGFCFANEANITTSYVMTIKTPGFPGYYPSDISCFYYVQAPDETYIKITVLYFETEMTFDVLVIKVIHLISCSVSLTIFNSNTMHFAVTIFFGTGHHPVPSS